MVAPKQGTTSWNASRAPVLASRTTVAAVERVDGDRPSDKAEEGPAFHRKINNLNC